MLPTSRQISQNSTSRSRMRNPSGSIAHVSSDTVILSLILINIFLIEKNPVPHCGLGMVFAVNCGPSGAPNSFDNFKAAALAQGAAFASSASAANPYGGSPTPVAQDPGAAPPSTITAAPDAEPSTVVATITLDSSTWTTTYASFPNSPNPTPVSLEGVTHNVVVGDNGTLTFDPPHIVA